MVRMRIRRCRLAGGGGSGAARDKPEFQLLNASIGGEACDNHLIAAVHFAFSDHYALTLSPDMIW